ncbi:MAG TPA: hypothetical protein VIM65_02535 [Cyclobacteriaceae bacterium]
MKPSANSFKEETLQQPETILSQRDESVSQESFLAKEVSPSRFIKIIFLWVVLGIVLIVGLNLWIDIYGLFRPVANRSLPVYYNERVSKYLLSENYIPEKFNTVIVGTSLSANLDISEFNNEQSKLKIYNASLMGANISELRPVVDNLVQGGVKRMIICFSPYMIKNSGSKEVEFGPKLYIGALGSKNLLDTYIVGIIRHYNLMPAKFPRNQINEFGVNRFGDLYKVENVKEKIEKVIKADKELTVDSIALHELQLFIEQLKDNHIQFIGYFHPIPAEVLASKRAAYENFERTVRQFVNDDSRLLNFNTSEFEYFTKDYSNYIDHGHLSAKGQDTLTKILITEHTKRYPL